MKRMKWVVVVVLVALVNSAWAYDVVRVYGRFGATAGETLVTGYSAALKDADGYVYKADADTAAIRPAIGVIGSKAGASGAEIEIITSGILTGWSGLAEGAPVYLSATAGAFTQTAPAYRQAVGFAVSATDIYFNFGGNFTPGVILGATTSAADSLAIPVTHAIVTKTTGADAEALTLANGAAGQMLTITLGTDGGGDGTLTPTTKTGWATCVLADAGDTISLLYVDDTVGWIIMGCYGLSAQPVITK